VASQEVTEWNDLHMLVPVQVDPYILIDHLHKNASYEEIMDFIVAIDEIMADWDFTKLLIDYAETQQIKLEEEERGGW
jgi:hypothetical protein